MIKAVFVIEVKAHGHVELGAVLDAFSALKDRARKYLQDDGVDVGTVDGRASIEAS